MQLRPILLVPVVIAAITLLAAEKIDPAQMMFEAAKKKEVVDGDLNAAIQQYKAIASKYAGDRAVAANALIRMADCYQKLGDAESQKIYERVLRDYGDQKEAVAVARARLGRNAASTESGVTVRQLWAGDDVNLGGSSSPDGRYFVYTDWKSENLAVRDLKSGENRFLTRDAGAGGRHAGALYPIFSPDGKQIVYEWHDKQDSLRLIGFDGTRMRVLTTTAPRPLPVAWSPDGKQIVAILSSEDGTHQIALISALDGSTTPLKSTGWRQPSVGGFSPDSRLLVYSLPKSIPSAGDGGIFAIAVDGSREAALVQGPANDANPFWSPDGQRVVFTSDRSGTKGLWSLRVADGRPQGSPELVRANIGDATTKGFSQDGSYFYGTYNIQADVYAADIDPETLRAVSQPSRVTEKFVGSNWGPAWSPDGRSIAFFRALDSSQSRAIVIRSVSTGEERTVPVRIQQGGYFPGYFCPHWFPDGRSVLVLDTADSRWLFKRIDIETGDVKVILEGLRIHQQVRLSPDGKILYYSVRGEHMPHSEFGLLRLMKRDLETGQELELYRTESPGVGFFGLAVSSDGNHLSFLRNDVENGKRTLFTLPAKGGTPRELYKGTYDKPTPFSGAWTRDGRHVLFTSHTDARGQLWAIPAEGGEPRALDITMQQILFPALSPDGRRIAFTGTRSRGELWVIHNLLSETQASR